MAKDNKEEKVVATNPAENSSVSVVEAPSPEELILAKVREKADEIIANAEAKAKEILDGVSVASQGTNQTEKIPYEKRPEVMAEIARGEEKILVGSAVTDLTGGSDLFISIGTDNVNLQRGKQVMIKRKFFEVYKQSCAANEKSRAYIEKMSGKSQLLTNM